jgi:hypothetical protein
MQTRFQDPDSCIGMVVVVQAHIDGIDGCVIQQLLKGAVGLADTEFGGSRSEGGGITVGNRYDFCIIDCGVVLQMLLGDLTASDDSNPDLVPHLSAPEKWQTLGKHF